jgi:hypothetical protein
VILCPSFRKNFSKKYENKAKSVIYEVLEKDFYKNLGIYKKLLMKDEDI